MREIFTYMKPYKKLAILAALSMTTATVCQLLLPTYMSSIVDRGIYAMDFSYILRCCLYMLLISLLSLGTMILGQYCASRVVAGFSADLRFALFRKVNAMSFDEISTFGTGALLTRSTHDVGTVGWVASMMTGSIITIPALFLGGVVLSFLKDPTLATIILLFIPMVFAVIVFISKKITPMWQKSDTYIDKQNDLMRQRLRGIRVIRAFCQEPRSEEEIADATQVMAENIIGANTSMGLISPIAMLALNCAVLLIVYLGGWRMESGSSHLSGGDIFAIVQYVALILSGLVMAGQVIVMFPHAKVAASRISEITTTVGKPEPPLQEDLKLQGNITFDHVTFKYEGADVPAVADVSLTVGKGQRIAVIGGTGSGKSTLVQLLMGFRSVTQGRILLDGVPMTELNSHDVRRNISCVLQKTAVFQGSIRENLLLGRKDATDDALFHALEIAQFDEFVRSNGLDYDLKMAGSNLSGGQKQRLCIARAILKDAPIFVFDDSFSALDFLTESRLRSRLNQETEGRTQLIITQRVTTAMHSDCIFVMDQGRLVDFGLHADLLERCQVYREIFASQTGGAA